MSRAILKLLAAGAALLSAGAAHAAGGGDTIARQQWPFAGFWGQYDQAQLQRGFQVYKEVCSACHGLNRIRFRNLSEPGGPEFPEDRVKQLAAEWPNQIPELDDAGETAVATKGADGKPNGFTYVKRPARPSDPILGPYANEKAARAAQNGALPPDLSLMAKARNVENHSGWMRHVFLDMPLDIVKGYQEGGADYLYALFTGYKDQAPAFKRDDKGRLHAVADAEAGANAERCASVAPGEDGKPDTCNALAAGMSYNAAFPGHQIAMPAPLQKDAPFKYQDGSGTLEENSKDIAAFLTWAADPSMNTRKRVGWQVLLYLLATTLLLYIGKRRIWSRVH